ncbi:hypothetical protein pipiens_014859, partial [Culex pipiens pipiens]
MNRIMEQFLRKGVENADVAGSNTRKRKRSDSAGFPTNSTGTAEGLPTTAPAPRSKIAGNRAQITKAASGKVVPPAKSVRPPPNCSGVSKIVEKRREIAMVASGKVSAVAKSDRFPPTYSGASKTEEKRRQIAGSPPTYSGVSKIVEKRREIAMAASGKVSAVGKSDRSPPTYSGASKTEEKRRQIAGSPPTYSGVSKIVEKRREIAMAASGKVSAVGKSDRSPPTYSGASKTEEKCRQIAGSPPTYSGVSKIVEKRREIAMAASGKVSAVGKSDRSPPTYSGASKTEEKRRQIAGSPPTYSGVSKIVEKRREIAMAKSGRSPPTYSGASKTEEKRRQIAGSPPTYSGVSKIVEKRREIAMAKSGRSPPTYSGASKTEEKRRQIAGSPPTYSGASKTEEKRRQIAGSPPTYSGVSKIVEKRREIAMAKSGRSPPTYSGASKTEEKRRQIAGSPPTYSGASKTEEKRRQIAGSPPTYSGASQTEEKRRQIAGSPPTYSGVSKIVEKRREIAMAKSGRSPPTYSGASKTEEKRRQIAGSPPTYSGASKTEEKRRQIAGSPPTYSGASKILEKRCEIAMLASEKVVAAAKSGPTTCSGAAAESTPTGAEAFSASTVCFDVEESYQDQDMESDVSVAEQNVAASDTGSNRISSRAAAVSSDAEECVQVQDTESDKLVAEISLSSTGSLNASALFTDAEECVNAQGSESDDSVEGKKKRYAQKYKPEWEKQLPWLKREGDKAYCEICEKFLEYKKGGLKDLKTHQKLATHKLNATKVKTKKTSKLHHFMAKDSDAIDAHIKLCLYGVEKNLSFTALETLVPVVQSICKDSKIATTLRLHRTKATCILHNVTGETQKQRLINIMRRTYFSIIVDESTNISTEKVLCIVVRFYDEEVDRVRDAFYDLLEIADGKAETLYAAIRDSFVKNKIPYTIFLLGLACDNANVMTGSNHSLFTLLRNDCPHIVLIRCVCHSMALCASYAVSKLPEYLEQTMKDIYGYITASPARLQQYKEIQELLEHNPTRVPRLHDIRFLSRGNVVSQVLKRYNALQIFFGFAANVDKLSSAIKVKNALEDPITLLYFEFLNFVLPLVDGINKLFQAERPEVISMLSVLTGKIKQILGYFVEPHVLKTDLKQIKVERAKFKRQEDVYYGVK